MVCLFLWHNKKWYNLFISWKWEWMFKVKHNLREIFPLDNSQLKPCYITYSWFDWNGIFYTSTCFNKLLALSNLFGTIVNLFSKYLLNTYGEYFRFQRFYNDTRMFLLWTWNPKRSEKQKNNTKKQGKYCKTYGTFLISQYDG